jgi:hypothetical protein
MAQLRRLPRLFDTGGIPALLRLAEKLRNPLGSDGTRRAEEDHRVLDVVAGEAGLRLEVLAQDAQAASLAAREEVHVLVSLFHAVVPLCPSEKAWRSGRALIIQQN